MKTCIVALGICVCIFLLSLAPSPQRDQSIGVEGTLSWFKKHSVLFAESCNDLQARINDIREDDPSSITAARSSLQQCRLQFKNIEFFFNYFFRSLTLIYNAPAVIEVEEPYMEYREPTGLQVIAALLFSSDPVKEKEAMLRQIGLVHESAKDINSLLYNLPVNDKQILESIQLELINLMTLGIAGFDAQELKTGIKEARQTLLAFQSVLSPYLKNRSSEADSVAFYLGRAIQLTVENNEFDTFNRLAFLTDAAIPLQQHLNKLIREKGLELNTTGILNYAAGHLFSPDAIDIDGRLRIDTALATLGQKLFFEKALSGNSTRSCATCHRPEKYFTDGLPKSLTLDGHSTVRRNSPSLLYSVFQYSQFWDGRAKSLEEQIKEVLKNPEEMNGDPDSIVDRLKKDNYYVERFGKVFREKSSDSFISMDHISLSIATFLETLTPFDSPFDRYIQGDRKALNTAQIKGFNLFMGKAMCGTCHVAPLFNGLTPPWYDRTAMEVIGTTNNIDFMEPKLDTDSGRYSTFPIEYYLRAFKTPGLRNVAATAPYMHNGAFPDLQSVVEFYNQGGGQGLGLDVAHQTLSPARLRLDESEILNIVEFLQSLTDKKVYKVNR